MAPVPGLGRVSCGSQAVSLRAAPAQMRVGFDMVSAGAGFAPGGGGIPPYYEALVRALSQHPEVGGVVAFTPPWTGGFGLPREGGYEVVRCRGLLKRRGWRVAYEQTALPMLIARHGIDVFLSTCNVVPFLSPAASVVVLQSIQYFTFQDRIGRARDAYLRLVVPRSLRAAGEAIAVSETERQDAIELFGLDSNEIRTVHHGMTGWAREYLDGAPLPPGWRVPDGRPYVLSVSSLYEFKNYRRLIESMAQLIQQGAVPHSLVIAGRDADVTRGELQQVATRLGVADRVHLLGRVTQDKIASLFTGAEAIAYVSLYETFGHPVLEAFAFGKPLVTSSIGATAEIAGGAARLVDPSSIEDIAAGLRDVLTDEGLRSRLAERGPARAREFSWEACADGTVSAMQDAMRRRGRLVDRFRRS